MKKIFYRIFLSILFILLIFPFDPNICGSEEWNSEDLSAVTDLSYWGMENLSQIRYVSLGVMDKTRLELSHFSSFCEFAIHSFQSYRRMKKR